MEIELAKIGKYGYPGKTDGFSGRTFFSNYQVLRENGFNLLSPEEFAKMYSQINEGSIVDLVINYIPSKKGHDVYLSKKRFLTNKWATWREVNGIKEFIAYKKHDRRIIGDPLAFQLGYRKEIPFDSEKGESLANYLFGDYFKSQISFLESKGQKDFHFHLAPEHFLSKIRYSFFNQVWMGGEKHNFAFFSLGRALNHDLSLLGMKVVKD